MHAYSGQVSKNVAFLLVSYRVGLALTALRRDLYGHLYLEGQKTPEEIQRLGAYRL